MKFGRPRRRLTKTVAVIGIAALVVAGSIVSSGTGQAVQAQLTQLYNCPFPLIGNQDVSVQITAEQPATVATGQFTPAITIAAVANAGATATQGLRLIGAETIEGSATATSTVTAPADQGALTVQVGASVPKQPIPPVGLDLVVNSSGSAPGLRFDKPGSAAISVTGLELEMTPRKADGTLTDLGTFKSACVLKAGQPTQLHSYTVTGNAVTPETIVGQGNVPPLRQVYTCPFPLIGNQDVTVDINASLPGTVKAGDFVPKFDITAVANAGTTATQGLRLIGAETVEGSANATSLVNFPGGHLAVQVPTNVPKQAIPAVGNPLITNASGGAPALRFDNPGTATLSVHDLILTLTPRRADGTPTDLGTFTADCTLKDGQTNVLHTFTISSGADTEKPSAPTNLRTGTVTATSVPLSWDASTDNVGVVGYEVRGAGQTVPATGTSATITGLTADTEYSFTVVAKDAAGNVSDPSAALTVRTGTAPDTEKPSVPTNLAVTGATETSIALSWSASTDNVGVTGYDVFQAGALKTSVTGTTATVDGLTADTAYTFTVSAKDAAGNVSDQSAPVTGRTLPAPDSEAPSVPGNLRAGDITTSSIGLSWNASTDNVGVTAYNVFLGDQLKTTVSGPAANIAGLAEDTEYTFTVSAKDAAGNESARSAAVTARTLAKPDTTPPTAPGNLRTTGVTETSIALAWDAAADNVGVVGYEVRGAGRVVPATGTTATFTGLTPDTEYSFTVVAKDAAGNVSPAGAAVTARTKPQASQEIPFAFDLTGKTVIKAVNGTVPLRGGIAVLVNLATGTFNGDLTLAPTQGNFKLFGFIPVSAKIEFAQADKTVGTISPDFVLASKSHVTVKLPRVSVFGFPISTSPSCQTKTPAEIPLMSKPGFNPITGGTLTGVYTLPALKGCGPLNGLISAVTAGPGNTIEVNLTPKPATR